MIENLLPKYLFKKKSSTSSHIPQGAPFSSTEAIKNGKGFQPLFSPREQLQKKQIYLNYQSIFRLCDKNERALIIAKLKEEGFEIFFICEKNKKLVLVEINQDLEVEINNIKKSIFLLDDRDLEKLSQIDRKKVINKLGLAIDDSIILEYHQFKEIADILGVNSWVQKGIFKSHLRLSDVDFLNGSEIKYEESIKDYLHQKKFDDYNLGQMMINYFQLPDFDTEDEKIRELLSKFIEHFEKDKILCEKQNPLETIHHKLSATTNILVNAIKLIYQDNPENVKKIFDYLFNYQFPRDKDEDKIIFQKFLVQYFWFYHPDFSELITKAQTISGFGEFNQDQIAEDLLGYKIKKITEFDKHIDIERLGDDLGKKVIERYIERYLDIQIQAQNGNIDICDYFLILLQYGVKLNFKAGKGGISLSINDGEDKELNPLLFIQLLNNKELSDQFRIYDLLIEYFKIFINHDITTHYGYYNYKDFYQAISSNFDYLPPDFQDQFVNKYYELIDSIDNHDKLILILRNIEQVIKNPELLKKISCKLIENNFLKQSYNPTSFDFELLSLIKILQHGIENKGVKDFVEKILVKLKEDFDFGKLTPEFEDFLITFHQEGKIDLAKFSFDKKSKISEKFCREQFYHKKTTTKSDCSIHISPETYLANYHEAHKNRFITELSEVSSKQLNQSPIQFYLLDLNQESLRRIQDLIAQEKLDANKIISLNILGFGRHEYELEDSENIDIRNKDLIAKVIKLFPNIKHLRVNKHLKVSGNYFEITDIYESAKKEKLAIEFVDYGNIEISGAFNEDHLLPHHQQNASGVRLRIANQVGICIASKSLGDNSFNMVDVGVIIHRPESKTFVMTIRNSCNKLEIGNSSLQEDWLPSFDDQSKLIPSSPRILSKNDFDNFSPQEDQKQTHSFCSFTIDLKANIKSKLLSISPDNEIVGYFTDPQVDNVKFFKDDAGFFYVECPQKCTIKYILKGQELDYKTPQDDLADLTQSVKGIIQRYVGDNKHNFPLSVAESQYDLPSYNFDSNSPKTREDYNKEWLDKLFDISNKGSCRHRVMALANKFHRDGLQYNQDFRIIGVNNNHILFEVKTKVNSWITLDLGGSQSQSNYQAGENYQAPNATGDEKNLHSEVDSPDPSPSISPQSARPLDPSLPLPNQAQDDPEFKILEEKILKLYQLQSSKDLKGFKQSLTSFIQTSENKSLLLTTNYFQELKNYLLFFKKTPFAIETEDREIIHEDSDLSFYIIESPQDLAIKKDSIKIIDSDAQITLKTPLAEFIDKAETQNTKTHLLIIDWQKFDDKHRVASNTMFDQSTRTIDGKKIPDNVKIICIDEAKSQSVDPAVLSRFSIAIDLRSISKIDLLSNEQDEERVSGIEEIIEFDGEGMQNWQQKLFGRIVVDGEYLKWQKSQFVKDLDNKEEKEKCSFQFKNFSKQQQRQILELFNQAKIQGFINYFGYKIKIPQNFSIKFDQAEFDFTGILKSFSTKEESSLPKVLGESSAPNSKIITLEIHKKIQSLDAIVNKENLVIINSQLFDQLLVKKSIEGSRYQENKGLIEEHKNKTLKLFITEKLTPAQLYCLMFNAKKHQVSLELYFAKNVKIDNQNFFRFYKSSIEEIAGDQDLLFSPESPASPVPSAFLSSDQSRIIVSNDTKKAFNELKQKLKISNNFSNKSINVVNIEDVLFSDLFDDVKHQITESSGKRYFSFQKQESEVIQKLTGGEVVVLKGKFPPDLLSSLHEKILDLKTQYPNLYFIIEEDILQSSKESSQLVWLDPKKYLTKYYRKEEKIQEIPIAREDTACVEEQIPQDSKQRAQDFIIQRKSKLKELLDKNSALQILGHSGVGKSSLFREIKKTGLENPDDVSVFEELENLEKWANDSSSKTKILVIDEFNVDGSTNFTMFRDFVDAKADSADQSEQKIFYKGKFYQLSENHRVVFLGNPHNYGNRFKHKLFSDCQVQEWQLMDFSQSYIYENILKEPIFDKLSQEIKGQLSEENFKEIAVEAIRKYYENNQKKSDDESDLPQETVRELQERVLQEIVKQIQTNITQEVANDNFISTQANQETIKQLQIAIKIRQLQKQKHFPPECLGTSGVIFEGDSGVGKSVMIEAVLQNQGIKKIATFDSLKRRNPSDVNMNEVFQTSDKESQPQHFYYKIDASLSYQEIKEKLIQAFELGVIVVIDELNTRINEGLEKDINALLTGQHPTDSSIKMKSGFMIITSVNKASSAGRSNFSNAIKHRCNNISALSLSEYRDEDFVKIIVNWCEKNPLLNQQNFNLKLVKKIAKNFRRLVAHNPEVNLRALKTKFDEITGEFLQRDQSLRASDQSLDQKLNLKKFNQNDIYFFSPEGDKNQHSDNRQIHENFHFRVKKSPEGFDSKKEIFETLKVARDNLGISDDDMIQFAILAIKYQGLKNVFNNPKNTQKIEEDFARIFGENWQEKKSQSIKFSANFQKILQKKDILTGRALNWGEVGMRLKRLDPELLQEFLLKDVKAPLKKEFIKDNFLNKFNKIMNISNSNLQDSIQSLYPKAHHSR